ncbi:MAG: hypothetical protein K8J31_24540 [Anaerolineae bacterium]|nr:hypothetical protein [Anaerolineae bacterium]
MITIEASIPCSQPPRWALLERQLFDTIDRAVHPYVQKYFREDGSIIWRDEWPETRDGLDDFYESFVHWPLYYALGGGDHVLALAHKHFDALTHQFANLGPRSPIVKEYERGYDQFHQSEGYLYFYYLCLADPTHPKSIERARRFAGFFMNEDPDALNYDPEHKILRAPHNGSEGPRWGYLAGDPPRYGWSAGMRRYGLPYDDVPGIQHYDDLKDPELTQRMGAAMEARMGRGDVANNLLVTGLMMNAYLLTGDEKYTRWLLDYVDAWVERARQNGGLLPDNVGLSGEVGEYVGGRWYGSAYGWSWPHGFHNIGYAAVAAANNAYLLTGDAAYFDLARVQMDAIIALGKMARLRDLDMSLGEAVLARTGMDEDAEEFVVPQRYKDSGWFDYQPMPLSHPVAVWNLSQDPADWARIEDLRRKSHYDWRTVTSFRSKADDGHEGPWITYLSGENPDYPEKILEAAYDQVIRRVQQVRADTADVSKVHIHHWQQLNPVTAEALVQLTLGAPQVVYYGGMLLSRVRYYDAQRQRPGLPQGVAALVEKVEPERTVLTLVNLNAFEARDVIIQAGGLGEHHFTRVTYNRRSSDWPGDIGTYMAPPLETEPQRVAIDDRYLKVHLPPTTQITLNLEMRRRVYPASYQTNPWD